jgi:DNA polymerase-3 subunit delta
MSEILYKELKNYLTAFEKNRKTEAAAPVYLIYGEELLWNTALETLLDTLIPGKDGSLNYDSVDGTNENIKAAIERVNTYSLLSGTKVVAIIDSKIFYSKQDESTILGKAKEAFDGKSMKTAAKYLLSLMGLLNLTFDDVSRENRSKALKLDPEKFSDGVWFDKIVEYCTDKNLSIPSEGDNVALLQNAVEKGFPEGNHLIITTDMVDKRRKLYKIIRKKGVIINCSVPKGARRADQLAQEAVLAERMETLLHGSGKTMDRRTFRAMYELTGFDLRIFSENLNTLISYVGDRKKITQDDVENVLKRTKKDPIYEFTNAISDRNVEKSLFFLDSLLSDNLHPLQLLAAITNQIRKLLIARGFIESAHGRSWHSGIQYGQFKSSIMPAVQIYDRDILDQLREWDGMLLKNVGMDKPRSEKVREKKPKPVATDLVIAKNSQNPYPVFQMLLKSEKFTTDELIAAFEKLSEADLRLKSTRQSKKLVLEQAILGICR